MKKWPPVAKFPPVLRSNFSLGSSLSVGVVRARLIIVIAIVFALWLLLAARGGGEQRSSAPLPWAGGALPRHIEKGPAAAKPESSWVGVCAIQGSGFESPFVGQNRVTRGIVVADFDDHGLKGFFIEDAACDANANTSNGLMVYLGERVDIVQTGDYVQAGGQVQEFFGQTELVSSPAQVSILSQGHALPEPAVLDPPFDNGMARFYFESLEGMQVALDAGRVVGPTSAEGKTWIIDAALDLERVFQDDPAGTGEVITLSGDGLAGLPAPAAVGDSVGGIQGVVAYAFGAYQIYLTVDPVASSAVSGPSAGHALPARGSMTAEAISVDLTTFNVQNLFDPFDNPEKEDPVLSPAAYDRKLGKLAAAIHDELSEPALIALQEVENDLVLTDLINRPELSAAYGYVWADGPDVRGIDTALLYRKDRIEILGYEQRQGCTGLIDGLGPDGNRDVQLPENALTCDLNGDGVLDGNRLFSRPPLLVHAALCVLDCVGKQMTQTGSVVDIWIVVNHWKSKSQDTFWTEYTLPRRMEQAAFVAGLLPELHATLPEIGVFVVGDFNDYASSGPLATLTSAGLHDTLVHLNRAERYTFIYQGVSQVLDYVMFSPSFGGPWIEPAIRHFNFDFPEVLAGVAGTVYRSADHDPLFVRLTFDPPILFLPMVFKPP